MRKTIFTVIVLMLLCAAGAAFAQKVSDEARRYFDRGMAAVEMAKTPADYEKAIAEFEKAKSLAPNWPAVYYNLGLIQDKVGMYSEAMANLRQYLVLAPKAKDAEAVRTLINKLDYKKEQIGDKYGKFTDPRDGKIYKTVKIGNQTWMAENLKYDAESKCADDSDEVETILYGCRYDWEAANNACPSGWHLPARDEWEILTRNMGSDPGNKLKSSRIEDDGCVGTNESGFDAVFHKKGASHIFWWSSTLFEKNKVWVPALTCRSGRVDWYKAEPKTDNRFAVRCIRD